MRLLCCLCMGRSVCNSDSIGNVFDFQYIPNEGKPFAPSEGNIINKIINEASDEAYLNSLTPANARCTIFMKHYINDILPICLPDRHFNSHAMNLTFSLFDNMPTCISQKPCRTLLLPNTF